MVSTRNPAGSGLKGTAFFITSEKGSIDMADYDRDWKKIAFRYNVRGRSNKL